MVSKYDLIRKKAMRDYSGFNDAALFPKWNYVQQSKLIWAIGYITISTFCLLLSVYLIWTHFPFIVCDIFLHELLLVMILYFLCFQVRQWQWYLLDKRAIIHYHCNINYDITFPNILYILFWFVKDFGSMVKPVWIKSMVQYTKTAATL